MIGSSNMVNLNRASFKTFAQNDSTMPGKAAKVRMDKTANRNPEESLKQKHFKGDTKPLSFDRLETINISLNHAANHIKKIDAGMEKINKNIDKMKAGLNAIVKNYPPFPPGSEERTRRLKEIDGFSRLIAKLTIPREQNTELQLTSKTDASVGKETGQLSISLKDNTFLYTVKKSEPDTTNLKLPEINHDLPDDEIPEIIKGLDGESNIIGNQRKKLAEDASGLSRLKEESGLFVDMEFPAMDDDSADTKSMETGQRLQRGSFVISTDNYSQLSGLIR